MTTIINIHPQNPQPRSIQKCAEILELSGIAALPTDCCYVLAAKLENREGMEKMAKIRKIDLDHNFTLMCKNLSDISTYSKISNQHFRLLKSIFPGAFTVLLQGTKEVPKKLLNPKRSTIGLRIPDFKIIQNLIEILGKPLLTCSLIVDGENLNEADGIREKIGKLLDLIVKAENHLCEGRTTIIDLQNDEIKVIRKGKGDIKLLGIE